MRSQLATAATAVILAMAVSGCGPSPATLPAGAGGSPTVQQALEDLAVLLKTAKQPPARPADLEQHEAVYVGATVAISQKTIVYQWGQGLTGGPAVVAYDAKAPTDGGYVLLQDGTVKSMTAAEFAAAPKAGKK